MGEIRNFFDRGIVLPDEGRNCPTKVRTDLSEAKIRLQPCEEKGKTATERSERYGWREVWR
jgi:hypothetical protein